MKKWCRPHFLMQICLIFFREGHYFLDIQYFRTQCEQADISSFVIRCPKRQQGEHFPGTRTRGILLFIAKLNDNKIRVVLYFSWKSHPSRCQAIVFQSFLGTKFVFSSLFDSILFISSIFIFPGRGKQIAM